VNRFPSPRKRKAVATVPLRGTVIAGASTVWRGEPVAGRAPIMKDNELNDVFLAARLCALLSLVWVGILMLVHYTGYDDLLHDLVHRILFLSS
jgi:hypothetical protein